MTERLAGDWMVEAGEEEGGMTSERLTGGMWTGAGEPDDFAPDRTKMRSDPLSTAKEIAGWLAVLNEGGRIEVVRQAEGWYRLRMTNPPA